MTAPGADRWWWFPPGSPRAGRPLLFFPPAGADQSVAAPLVPHLAGVRFGVLRVPGRGIRADEPPPASLAELGSAVVHSIEALDGPRPVLAGHSFGSLMAFGAAQELERRGRPPARLVAIAGTAPLAWHRRRTRLPPPHEYVPRRVAQLFADGGVPAAVAADPELAGQARAMLETDVRLSLDPLDPAPVSCPLTSVRARDDELVDAEGAALWHEASTSEVDEIVVPGGHFFYRTAPRVLAGLLAGEMSQLDGAYGPSV